MKYLLLAIPLFFFQLTYAQKVDTIFNEGYYKSYYSYSIKDPLYVTDSLYKGGGECSRKGDHFTGVEGITATDKDYAHSGFDKGHLADAEDFAFDCDEQKGTFKYYNCLPQTPRLNRGIWKVYEEKIRELSQSTHLFIIAGGIYSTKTIGDRVGVPDYCYKIVYDDEGQLRYCLLFPNNNSDMGGEITLAQLKELLGYPLVY
ncbi:MAG: DNA/RNA non-specific endonuclease [Ferruginibacter sp.]